MLSGNREAFGALVTRYHSLVYHVALSHAGNPADAEDLTQEAFLKAYRSIDGLKEPERLKSWLYSIAKFTAIDWVRKRQREETRPLTDDHALPDFGRTDERSGRALKVIDGLREDYRELLVLRYQRELSYADIAKELGVSISVVGERLHRVLELVRDRLRSEVHP